jgi:hypothetical protein
MQIETTSGFGTRLQAVTTFLIYDRISGKMILFQHKLQDGVLSYKENSHTGVETSALHGDTHW